MSRPDPQIQMLFFAGILGFFGVAFAASGAHGLDGQDQERTVAAMRTGADYALIHAVALLGLGLHLEKSPRLLLLAGWSFIAGAGTFMGSLTYFGQTGVSDYLWITPIGGGLMILGWFLVIIAASMNYHSERNG